MARIVLQDITKLFGDVLAVDAVSLEIADGEFMVLVGPSGCGKSTILRMVAGLEEVTAGEIVIDDQMVTDLPSKSRDIAMVFQNYALYPHMTVEQNIAFGLRLRHTPKDEIKTRVHRVARTLGIEGLLHRKPAELSGGQRQRVAMGRAMVREPKAFLMDEPLSNLDAKLRVQMRTELARLHTRLHTTTIFVTHDQIEAMTLGDRVAVLRDGLLQQVGTPQELFRSPANLFVASFIGSPAMNLVEAQVQGDAIAFADLRIPLDDVTAIAHLDGQSVIVGIRPSDLHQADSEQGAGPLLEATVDVIEDLGSEVHAIFSIDAPPVVTDMVAAAEDAEGTLAAEGLTPLAADRAVFTASLDARTDARPGRRILLSIDRRSLHFFDPTTGVALRGHQKATAPTDVAGGTQGHLSESEQSAGTASR